MANKCTEIILDDQPQMTAREDFSAAFLLLTESALTVHGISHATLKI
jgi:hypothetical protein